MTVEIKVPTLGESVTEATSRNGSSNPAMPLPSMKRFASLKPTKSRSRSMRRSAGALKEIVAAEGSDVGVGALLGTIDEGAEALPHRPPHSRRKAACCTTQPAAAPPPPPRAPHHRRHRGRACRSSGTSASRPPLSPAVRKMVDDNDLDAAHDHGTGPDGRLTKGDVLKPPLKAVRQTPCRRSQLRQPIVARLYAIRRPAAAS